MRGQSLLVEQAAELIVKENTTVEKNIQGFIKKKMPLSGYILGLVLMSQ